MSATRSTLIRRIKKSGGCHPNGGKALVVGRERLLSLLAVIFGGMYVNVGVQHFTNTAWFEPIVPAVLGDPTIWVLITGVMEIAIGVGLMLPWTSTLCGAEQPGVSRRHLLGEPQHVGQQHPARREDLRPPLACGSLGRSTWHDGPLLRHLAMVGPSRTIQPTVRCLK